MATKTRAQIETEYAEFRKMVETRVKTAIEDGDICREGGNQALRDFGFEPTKPTWSGFLYFTINVDNMLANEDEYGHISDKDAAKLVNIFTDALNAVEVIDFGDNFEFTAESTEVDVVQY